MGGEHGVKEQEHGYKGAVHGVMGAEYGKKCSKEAQFKGQVSSMVLR